MVVLEAKTKLIASPQHRSLVGLGYADAFAAADHVPEILEHHPIGLEGFEGAMIDGLRRKGAVVSCWSNLAQTMRHTSIVFRVNSSTS